MKLVKESLNEIEGIPWSGRDVTKLKPIGKVITKPIEGDTFSFPSEEMEVVEIIEDGSIFICNTWYKQYKHIPQLVHRDMVEEFIPYDDKELKESDSEDDQCEQTCQGCGMCLDNLSSYYQNEGYCEDCL